MKKKYVTILTIISLVVLSYLVIFVYRPPVKTTAWLEKELISRLVKDNQLTEKFSPEVTCQEIGKNHWKIAITFTRNGECNLSALSLLPDGQIYDIWLTVSGGVLDSLAKKNIQSLNIHKIGSGGQFNLSGLAFNKTIKNLSLVSMTENELKTLPELPGLVSFSVHFSQPASFDFSVLHDIKLQNLSFTNVSRFIDLEKHSCQNLDSIGLLRSDLTVLEKVSTKQLIIQGMKVDIDDLVKYLENLEVLVLKDCTLLNLESLNRLVKLKKLILNNCEPINRDLLTKMSIKEIIILPVTADKQNRNVKEKR